MRCPPRIVIVLSLGTTLAGGGNTAAAFQTGPWDGAGFTQPGGPPARALARIAGAEAKGLSAAGQTPLVVGRRSTGQTTLGPSGCQVNIGGIGVGDGVTLNNLDVTSNTVVNGDVITVCR